VRTLLATFGHSVVTDGDKWLPSELFQEVEFPEGREGRVVRTHTHRPALRGNEENAYLGGGQMCVKALFHLSRIHRDAHLMITGGRPRAMDHRFGLSVSKISEAGVMRAHFNDLAGQARNVKIVAESRTTEDDATAILDIVESGRFDVALVVGMAFRLPRARPILNRLAERTKRTDVADRVQFVDAEQFLPEHFDEFVAMNQSAAYALTMRQERHGIQKLLRGFGDYPRTA